MVKADPSAAPLYVMNGKDGQYSDQSGTSHQTLKEAGVPGSSRCVSCPENHHVEWMEVLTKCLPLSVGGVNSKAESPKNPSRL